MTKYTPRTADTPYYTPGHHDRDWMTNAACRNTDPEIFFPTPPRRPARYATQTALQTCLECPVIADCLHYALATDTRYGIWGGATSDDRARLTGRKTYG